MGLLREDMDLLTRPLPETDAARYAVFAGKDMSYDGQLFLAVTSTGIFCRPGCPARMPKPKNCQYYADAATALAAGFRACKRCHPSRGGEPAAVRQLIGAIEDHPDQKPAQILSVLDIDASTARRQFLARFGLSFSDYARARAMGRAATTLAKGGAVIDAQLNAGFQSASGFRAGFAKTFGTAPTKAAPDPLFIDWHDMPMGRMLAVADADALYMLEFTDRVHMARQFRTLQRRQDRAILPGTTPIHTQIWGELNHYFAGKLTQFTTPLATSGTEFQNKTWDALQTIPHGQTRSYAQLAEMIGQPSAVRAVANANGKNGLALIIPCHRVIASDGGLGGYAGGVSRKADLLSLEKPDN